MLGSSGPQGSCCNASIRCSKSSKCLCTLCAGMTSQRALSTLTFRAVRIIHPQCQWHSMLSCSANRNSPPLTPFQFSLVNCPLLPSLPPEPTPRGSQPHGTTCYIAWWHWLPPSNWATGSPTSCVSCWQHQLYCWSYSWRQLFHCSHCPHCSMNPE